MKFSAISIIGIASTASASTSAEGSSRVSNEFKSWMAEHSKRYESSATLFAAHKVFSANLKIIEELNADEGDSAE